MTITAKVVLDSISPHGVRITTLELRYHRYLHSEFMTHRVFSRNAASTRAIPTKKIADMVLEDLASPIRWGLNQTGMQAMDQDLSFDDQQKAQEIWRKMAETCVEGCKQLTDLGLHKQWAGRPLEPFMHMTVLVTSTEWANFFELRDHKDAQPEIRELAIQIKEAMHSSFPLELAHGEWHLPFVRETEQLLDLDTKLKISSARCARVSYLTHDGQTPSIEKDVGLYDRLVQSRPRHYSPLEHQATPAQEFNTRSGNFQGWIQHRKLHESQEYKSQQ